MRHLPENASCGWERGGERGRENKEAFPFPEEGETGQRRGGIKEERRFHTSKDSRGEKKTIALTGTRETAWEKERGGVRKSPSFVPWMIDYMKERKHEKERRRRGGRSE